MLIRPGRVGGIGGGKAPIAVPITFDLHQTFTGADTGALADTNTITGPGGGGTFESSNTADVGTWTVVKTVGTAEVLNNKFRLTYAAGTLQLESSSVTKVAGSLFLGKITPGTSSENAVLTIQQTDTKACYDMSNSGFTGIRARAFTDLAVETYDWTLTSHVPDGSEERIAIVGGGFASGSPDNTGTEGALFFVHNGSNWEHLAAFPENTVTTVEMRCSLFSSGSGVADFDDLFAPSGSTDAIPGIFTPAGYALESTVTGSTTFTHNADHTLMTEITTVPSSGTLDIVVRDDLALKITSAGALTLVKNYATTQDVIITSSGTVSNGSVIHLRQNGSSHQLLLDGQTADAGTDAANSTATGGSIGSLGTGGAVAFLYDLPAVSASYDSLLVA